MTSKNIVAVLPESKTFIKVIHLDAAPKTDLGDLITEEIKNHIPLALDDIYLDWQILKKNNDHYTVLVGAAPKIIVDSYLEILEKSGLTPQVLEIEAAAIIRSLIPVDDNQAKIIVDLGAVRTGIILYDQGTVQFSVSSPISGNEITATIAKTLRLDLVQAEKAKIICGLDEKKCDGALLKILVDNMDQLTNQIKKAIIFYKANFPGGQAISEILLCGGGANFSQLNKVLAEKLNLPVKIGNPLLALGPKIKLDLPKNKILSYTTSIGLALRSLQKRKISLSLNLLPPEKKQDLHLHRIYLLAKNLIIILLLYIIGTAIALLLTKMALQNNFNQIVEQTTLTPRYGNLFNKDIRLFNKRLNAVAEIQEEYTSWSDLIYQLTRLVPPNISLTNISFSPAEKSQEQILITGQAKTRDDLLAFKNNLESSTFLSEVNVPLDNLLKKDDISFSIKARLNLEN